MHRIYHTSRSPRLRQDELDDDEIMILDNGEQVFLWMGPRCSEVEVKLAYKSAQVSTGQVSTACDPAARRSGSYSFMRALRSVDRLVSDGWNRSVVSQSKKKQVIMQGFSKSGNRGQAMSML